MARTTRVVPDRIETGTFLVAAAVTGGKITLENAPCEHVEALLELLGRVGVPVACGTHSIEIDATGLRPGDLRACDIETAPYPGLATDLQPPACVLLTQAERHVTRPRGGLRGPHRVAGRAAQARRQHRHRGRAPRVDLTGPTRLHGAEAAIGDLRAGASLILAALAADGTSLIHGAHHVQRGYENIDRKFQQLGASITRSADTA